MNRKKTTTQAEAEVDELLKAVQDDMLLNLSLNSHLARVSPNYIDSDLDTRFRALKSTPSKSTHTKPSPTSYATADPPPQLPNQTLDPQPDPELKAVLGDDLSARFAKLRASLSQSPAAPISGSGGGGPNTSMESFDEDEEEDEDEDDEVEKLIRWAKDAARLDPSPPSDEDDYEDFDRK
ncbi:uncharacterized protein LOC133818889 [Humulus lupulus]|uniref:uncharacterized protein LOC133818889 n=1 Tax=Humulus lupulus TaxID=3486 RepID=UPI002B40100E|nr:uncharacterized protein LOC133818889 [Humulus lupulus]